MDTTKLAQTPTPSRLSRAGINDRLSFGLLAAVALCAAPLAFGQATHTLKGPHLTGATPKAVSALPTVPPLDSLYSLTVISPANSPYAVADGISNEGVVTGYYLDTSFNFHGFVWSRGNFQTVDYPGAAFTLLYGVSNNGLAIGYYNDGASDHVVTYSIKSGAWGSLPDIPNYSLNQGYCINDRGAAIGNAFGAGTALAWIWDPNAASYSFFAVPQAPGNSTFPSCINDKDEIAGYYVDSTGVYHGFILANGAYRTIDVPGAADTFPDGVNNAGLIQGQIIDSGGAADGFAATLGGSFQILNYPGAKATAIVGINDDGDVCGSAGGSGFANAVAFVATIPH